MQAYRFQESSFTTLPPGKQLDETGLTTIDSEHISAVRTGHISISNYFSFVQISEREKLCLYFYATPINQDRTRLVLLTTRNFMPGEDQDKKMIETNDHIVRQDVVVVSSIGPGAGPVNNVSELLLPEDRGVLSYRERIKDWTDRGWRIDVAALSADGGGRAHAVPSPARQESSNWVVRPVPLIQS